MELWEKGDLQTKAERTEFIKAEGFNPQVFRTYFTESIINCK